MAGWDSDAEEASSHDEAESFFTHPGQESHLFCDHEDIPTNEVGYYSNLYDNDVGLASSKTFMELLLDCDDNVEFKAPKSGGSNINDDIYYDDEGSDMDDEEIVDAIQKIKKDKKMEKEIEEEMAQLVRVSESRGLQPLDMDSDYEGTSDLESPGDSSDEEQYGFLASDPHKKHIRPKNKSYKIGSAPQETVFFLGQEFDNAIQFRKAITDYCVNHGKNVTFTRNDKDRIGGDCSTKGCPWHIWASMSKTKRTFRVTVLRPEHTCGRSSKVKKISSTWVANHYMKKFKINPYMKLQEIVDTVWLDWGIKVSMWLAVRARRKGQSLILGEYKEQYGVLLRYGLEILRANPDNTVVFKLDNGVFERMYISFKALSKGFLTGCRPFISIDGCFLKGPYGGQLLVAVGRDGNNQMFPIAWAVMEAEDGKSWSWFMSLLAQDLGTTEGAGFTIMSDQQKGLLKAVSEVWPMAEVRCCARHVYCNFRTVFGGGQELRRWFWRIAKSNTENEFFANIEAFRDISNAAADDLLKRNYKKWCRAFYTPQSSCDNIDNNMSEVFNAYILNSRHKPIITMLEDIRESLMERLHKKRDFIANKDGFLCPRIQHMLEISKYNARGWCAFWDGRFAYGVREGITQTKYVVNLLERTCSCNAWQVSGIPCNHAVAAIWNAKENPEHYVASWFTKTTYLKAYEFPMEPLNGPQEWPMSHNEPIMAPSCVKLSNRRTTKRKKQIGEETTSGKMKRTGTIITCSLCGVAGHNKRSCKNPSQVPPEPVIQKEQSKTKKNKQAPKQNNKGASTSTPQAAPMHTRGFGLYTYPNGFQRTGSFIQPRRAAYFTDFEGEQTLQSMTIMHDSGHLSLSQSSSASTSIATHRDLYRRHCISSQALQDVEAAFVSDNDNHYQFWLYFNKHWLIWDCVVLFGSPIMEKLK